MKRDGLLFAVGAALVFGGGAAANAVHTAGGVEVRDVRLPLGDTGEQLAAHLYVPPNATEQTPAPGVLAVHGYINSRETQSGFAIEFSRRGWVVLALDQAGHGLSEGTSGSEGYGGPAGLAYLRSLPFVDGDRIALEGHSMGGWASLWAAAAHPDGYRSVTVVGSSTGPGYAPEGSTTFPRNLGVVFPTLDEFAPLMWGVAEAADVGESGKLQAVFDTDEEVVPGVVYGSLADGTARWLATPFATHPGAHLSRGAIRDAVHWVHVSFGLDHDMPDDDQIWYWKELATLVALFGGFFLLLGTLGLLLPRGATGRVGARSLGRTAAPVGARAAGVAPGGRWWATLAVTTLLPALTYFPVIGWAGSFGASALFPQSITNQIVVWALVNGVLAVPAAFLIGRRSGSTPPPSAGAANALDAAALAQAEVAGEATADRNARGGRFDPGALSATLRPLVVAVAAVGVLYGAVALSGRLFETDLRFWVVALKPMAPHHLTAFLAYLLPITAFFYVAQRGLVRTLLSPDATPWGQYRTAVLATVGGFALMTGALYVHLFAAGRLPDLPFVGALFTVVAIQFVAVLTGTAVIGVFTWRRTGGVLTGAVVCGLLVTWYIVAGQATHV